MIDINDIKENHYSKSGFNQHPNDPRIGKHTKYTFNVLKNKKHMTADTAKKQLGKALEIFSFCNHRSAPRTQTTQGLVLGRVQSGKTTSFSLVSSLAADNGYRIIIHLLGTTNLLVKDNFEKGVKKNLGLDPIEPNPNLDWWYPIHIDKDTEHSDKEICDAISPSTAYWHDEEKKVLYFYLIKNTTQIEKLTNIVKKIVKKMGNTELPVLIIDDEVDSYSLNTKKENSDKTATYKLLEKLKKICGSVNYLGYTATTQGLWLAHDDSFLRPDCYAKLDTGKGYVGNFDLFGESSHLETPQDRAQSSNKRHQPILIDPMDYLSPNTRKDGTPIDYDLKKLRETLNESIADFLISWSFNLHRWKNDDNPKKGKFEPMSMMMLPATTARINNETPTDFIRNKIEKWVENELNNIRAYLLTPTNNNRFNNRFNTIYNRKVKNCSKKYSAPTFQESLNDILELFKSNKYDVVKVNQEGVAKITPENNDAWFVIGGIKLSRGFVVPGLLTTWMPFQPNTLVMDTTEQRGRFFGYKERYKDLISIYLQENTLDLFKKYTSIENHLFESVERGARDGLDFSSVDTNWALFDSAFPLTSSQKKRTKQIKKITSSWHTSLHSSFIDNNGAIKKNSPFNDDIENFVGKLTFQRLGNDKKYGISNGTAQDALHQRLKLDDVYNNLLIHLRDYLNINDKALKALIDAVRSSYLNKNWNCDIIYFDDIKNRSISKNCNKNIGWFFDSTGYKSGPYESKRQKGYVGDDYLIKGNKQFDPRDLDFDKDNNSSFTIQIHKIKNVWDKEKKQGGKILLNNVFGIRIHTPWDKDNSYYLGS